jgi:hypothetical protein
MANYQSGGAFLPEGDMNLKGTVNLSGVVTSSGVTSITLSGPTISSPTITGATISGTVATGSTIAAPVLSGTVTGTYTLAGTVTGTAMTLTAPVISGAATVASGATITTPTLLVTAQNVTSTGTGAADATVLSSITPAFVTHTTGATGSGIALPAAAAVPGAMYWISNQVAVSLRIYSSGATINGTTGTTAFVLTNTGNKLVTVGCTIAGAWIASGNT